MDNTAEEKPEIPYHAIWKGHAQNPQVFRLALKPSDILVIMPDEGDRWSEEQLQGAYNLVHRTLEDAGLDNQVLFFAKHFCIGTVSPEATLEGNETK